MIWSYPNTWCSATTSRSFRVDRGVHGVELEPHRRRGARARHRRVCRGHAIFTSLGIDAATGPHVLGGRDAGARIRRRSRCSAMGSGSTASAATRPSSAGHRTQWHTAHDRWRAAGRAFADCTGEAESGCRSRRLRPPTSARSGTTPIWSSRGASPTCRSSRRRRPARLLGDIVSHEIGEPDGRRRAWGATAVPLTTSASIPLIRRSVLLLLAAVALGAADRLHQPREPDARARARARSARWRSAARSAPAASASSGS